MFSDSTIDLLSKGMGQLATTMKTFHRALKTMKPNSSEPGEAGSSPEEEKPEAEGKKSLRFQCEACSYQSNHKGDFLKHCESAKHKKNTETEKEEENDSFEKIRKRYDELKDEKNLYFLTAVAYLDPLRMGSSGKQGMCCQPLNYLWDAIHKHLFGGTIT